MLRLFFALWPDARLAARLAALAQEISARNGGRPTRQETIHLTLAFLGNVPAGRLDELQKLAAAIRVPPFGLVLDRLDDWRHNRLAWAGASRMPDGLTSLVATLHAGLREGGFPFDDGRRAFMPHVTLVRRLPGGTPPVLPAMIPPMSWVCDEFRLVLSRLDGQGSAYETLGRYPLGSLPGESVSGLC